MVMVGSQIIDIFKITELAFYNLRFFIRGQQFTPSPIVIIGIDKETINKFGFPLSRNLYAEMIYKLKQANAGVIGFMQPLSEVSNAEDDKKLAGSILNAGNVVMSGYFKSSPSNLITTTSPLTYIPPLKIFTPNASVGYIRYIFDKDGFIRSSDLQQIYPSLKETMSEFNFSFAFQILNKYNIQHANNISNHYKNKTFYINYIGKDSNFSIIPFYSLLQQFSIPTQLTDKIVLIGRTDTNEFLTPFGRMSQVALQASIIDSMLRNIPITRAPSWLNNLFIIISAILSGIFIFYLGNVLGGIAFIGVLGLYSVINIFTFVYLRIWVDVVGVTVAGMSVYIIVFSNRLYFFFQKRIKLKNMFQRHLSPQSVQELLKKPQKFPDRRIVTILFTDITDFTSMSERLPTDEVVKLLNEYLTSMTEVIFKNKGTVDKYMGDRIMAVFGNIGESNPSDESYRAIKTALEMHAKLRDLQQKWLSEGLRPFQIRTGINSGEVLVAYIGSPQQMDFTVIGDTVNTASRLEELNKDYQTGILISGTTYNYVKDYIQTKYLGPVPIKGKKEPVIVYELVTWKIPPLSINA